MFASTRAHTRTLAYTLYNGLQNLRTHFQKCHLATYLKSTPLENAKTHLILNQIQNASPIVSICIRKGKYANNTKMPLSPKAQHTFHS